MPAASPAHADRLGASSLTLPQVTAGSNKSSAQSGSVIYRSLLLIYAHPNDQGNFLNVGRGAGHGSLHCHEACARNDDA
jgi:hypothetical protein